MESFSFHFVFLGKAHQVSEVARKLASAQTRSESVKASGEILQRKSLLVGYNLDINNEISFDVLQLKYHRDNSDNSQRINFDVKTKSGCFKHPPTFQIFFDFRQNAYLTHPRRPYVVVYSDCTIFICCRGGEI